MTKSKTISGSVIVLGIGLFVATPTLVHAQGGVSPGGRRNGSGIVSVQRPRTGNTVNGNGPAGNPAPVNRPGMNVPNQGFGPGFSNGGQGGLSGGPVLQNPQGIVLNPGNGIPGRGQQIVTPGNPNRGGAAAGGPAAVTTPGGGRKRLPQMARFIDNFHGVNPSAAQQVQFNNLLAERDQVMDGILASRLSQQQKDAQMEELNGRFSNAVAGILSEDQRRAFGGAAPVQTVPAGGTGTTTGTGNNNVVSGGPAAVTTPANSTRTVVEGRTLEERFIYAFKSVNPTPAQLTRFESLMNRFDQNKAAVQASRLNQQQRRTRVRQYVTQLWGDTESLLSPSQIRQFEALAPRQAD